MLALFQWLSRRVFDVLTAMFLPGRSAELVCRVDSSDAPVPPFVAERMRLACAYARAVARGVLTLCGAARLGIGGPRTQPPTAMDRLRAWASQPLGVLADLWTLIVSNSAPRFTASLLLLLLCFFFFLSRGIPVPK